MGSASLRVGWIPRFDYGMLRQGEHNQTQTQTKPVDFLVPQYMPRTAARAHRTRMPTTAFPNDPRHGRVRRAGDHVLIDELRVSAAHRGARLVRDVAPVRRALPRHGRQRRAGAAFRDSHRAVRPRAE
jgi:hypothetical protein